MAHCLCLNRWMCLLTTYISNEIRLKICNYYRPYMRMAPKGWI